MNSVPVYTNIGDDPYLYGIPLRVAKYFAVVIIICTIICAGAFVSGLWLFGVMILGVLAFCYSMMKFIIQKYGSNCVGKWFAYWGEPKTYVINRNIKRRRK